MISFAGISSNSVNLIVERYPARPIPSRRYTVTTIPGRSGNLLMDEEAFNNIEQAYDIYIRANGATTFQQSVTEVAEWLLAPSGYQKLYDSYDPDTYRMAYYSGSASITNALNTLGRATIKFNCKPWRYLVTGDDPISVADGETVTLNNPTGFDAAPLIEVKTQPDTTGTIEIGNYIVTIDDAPDDFIIDSELMDCYNTTFNMNGYVELTPAYEYPMLKPGANAIAVSGCAIFITPRWRTL